MGRARSAATQQATERAERPSHIEDADDRPIEVEREDDGRWPAWSTVPWHQELDRGHGSEIRTGYADSPDRNETRRLIRVSVESSNGMTILGQRVPDGDSYLLVYESDLPKVEKLLPTTKQRRIMELAEEQYRDAFETFVESECKGDRALAEKTCAFTVWTQYDLATRDMKGLRGGYPTLRAFEVHPEVVPAPDTQASRESKARGESNETIEKLVKTLLHLSRGGKD